MPTFVESNFRYIMRDMTNVIELITNPEVLSAATLSFFSIRINKLPAAGRKII
jgi:hypothetical protein